MAWPVRPIPEPAGSFGARLEAMISNRQASKGNTTMETATPTLTVAQAFRQTLDAETVAWCFELEGQSVDAEGGWDGYTDPVEAALDRFGADYADGEIGARRADTADLPFIVDPSADEYAAGITSVQHLAVTEHDEPCGLHILSVSLSAVRDDERTGIPTRDARGLIERIEDIEHAARRETV